MRVRYLRIGYWPKSGWILQWSADSVPPTATVHVERAEGEEGPWTTVSSLPSNTITYTDCLSNKYQAFYKRLYYRLRFEDGGQDILVTKPEFTENHSSLPTNEIIRQHDLLLYGVNGHPGYMSLYLSCHKPQRFGKRYLESRGWNGEPMIASSEADENTGFVEGYANPILFKGRFISTVQKQRQTQITGGQESLDSQLWMSNYPILEPGDLICEKGNGKVYEVRSVEVREPGGILVSQTAFVSQVSPQMYEAQNIFYPGDEP